MYQLKDEEKKNIGSPSAIQKEVEKFAQQYIISPLGAGQKVIVWWNDEIPISWFSSDANDGYPYLNGVGVCMVDTPSGHPMTGEACVRLRTMDWQWSSDKLNKDLTFHDKEYIGG